MKRAVHLPPSAWLMPEPPAEPSRRRISGHADHGRVAPRRPPGAPATARRPELGLPARRASPVTGFRRAKRSKTPPRDIPRARCARRGGGRRPAARRKHVDCASRAVNVRGAVIARTRGPRCTAHRHHPEVDAVLAIRPVSGQALHQPVPLQRGSLAQGAEGARGRAEPPARAGSVAMRRAETIRTVVVSCARSIARCGDARTSPRFRPRGRTRQARLQRTGRLSRRRLGRRSLVVGTRSPNVPIAVLRASSEPSAARSRSVKRSCRGGRLRASGRSRRAPLGISRRRAVRAQRRPALADRSA